MNDIVIFGLLTLILFFLVSTTINEQFKTIVYKHKKLVKAKKLTPRGRIIYTHPGNRAKYKPYISSSSASIPKHSSSASMPHHSSSATVHHSSSASMPYSSSSASMPHHSSSASIPDNTNVNTDNTNVNTDNTNINTDNTNVNTDDEIE